MPSVTRVGAAGAGGGRAAGSGLGGALGAGPAACGTTGAAVGGVRLSMIAPATITAAATPAAATILTVRPPDDGTTVSRSLALARKVVSAAEGGTDLMLGYAQVAPATGPTGAGVERRLRSVSTSLNVCGRCANFLARMPR